MINSNEKTLVVREWYIIRFSFTKTHSVTQLKLFNLSFEFGFLAGILLFLTYRHARSKVPWNGTFTLYDSRVILFLLKWNQKFKSKIFIDFPAATSWKINYKYWMLNWRGQGIDQIKYWFRPANLFSEIYRERCACNIKILFCYGIVKTENHVSFVVFIHRSAAEK